jgi:hypothetical protein
MPNLRHNCPDKFNNNKAKRPATLIGQFLRDNLVKATPYPIGILTGVEHEDPCRR